MIGSGAVFRKQEHPEWAYAIRRYKPLRAQTALVHVFNTNTEETQILR